MHKFLSISLTALIISSCGFIGSGDTDTGENSTVEQAATLPSASTDSRIEAQTEKLTARSDINKRLDAWFEEKFMEGARRNPQVLAQLGIKERMGEWNDPSRAFALEQLDFVREDLKELKANFSADELDEDHRLSYELYVQTAENTLEGAKWWYHNYPFNQMFGTHSSIPPFLINQHRIETIEDAHAYIERLNGVEDYLGTVVENSKASMEKGIMPPKFVYAHVIQSSKNIISGAPFDDGDYSIVMNDFRKKVEELNLPDAEREELYKEAISALLTSFKSGYDNVITEMQRQQDLASTDDGAWKLPDGDDYYAYRLKLMTTTDMSAKAIHELGLSEVTRIHGEMREIMRSVDFEGDLQDFFEFLKTDPQFTYEDSDQGRQDYLTEAERMINVMKGRLDEVFLTKPKADLVVKRVEAFRERSGSKAFYNRPAPDGSRPGIYYANLYKIEDMPKYQMEALAYHEGIPGHHMQLSISQELKGIPKFRQFGFYTAYSEGWGLYSEYLPKEMGFYSDPYSDFGRLAMELWRAARLVVDTGLHDKKWTREDAIDYLVENTPNPRTDCVKAIERYIVMPGQATAYKIGMLKILELRENAKERLGEDFDIREYHDVILNKGPVPLNVMERHVDEWAQSKN